MEKIILIGIALLVIIVAFMFLPDIITSTHEALTDEDTVAANITTGAGVTTGGVNLTETLWENDVGSVTSVTSTVGGDTPVAQSYSVALNRLTVSGLLASQTRVLTVVHEYSATEEYVGTKQGLQMAPTLIVLVLAIGIPGALIWKMFGSRG